LFAINENATKRIFSFTTKNTLESSSDNIAEEFDTREIIIKLTKNHSLAPQEEIKVFVAYDYTETNGKLVIAKATSGPLVEIESALYTYWSLTLS